MTSLHITRHTCSPGLTLSVYLGVWESWSTILVKNNSSINWPFFEHIRHFEKIQVGKDREKVQSEKDSHSKNQGEKNQTNNQGPVVQN